MGASAAERSDQGSDVSEEHSSPACITGPTATSGGFWDRRIGTHLDFFVEVPPPVNPLGL